MKKVKVWSGLDIVINVDERTFVKVFALIKLYSPVTTGRTSDLPSCVFAEGFLIQPIVRLLEGRGLRESNTD